MHILTQYTPRPRTIVALALILLVALLGLTPQATPTRAAGVIYVNINAATGGDGATWGTAYKYLQDALAAVADGDEIWVAAGVYYPDEDEGGNVTDDDQMAVFFLKTGLKDVSIYGGFAGSETSRDQRDWDANLTVLSGDIEQNDSTVNGVLYNPDGIVGTNSNNVVIGRDLDGVVLDGFTITGGDVEAERPSFSSRDGGGGIYLYAPHNVLLENLTVRGNRALAKTTKIFVAGGGIYVNEGSAYTIRRSIIRNNQGITGGGLYHAGPESLSAPLVGVIEESHILENETFDPGQACLTGVSGGGGIYLGGGHALLTDVVVEKNVADCFGGGILNYRALLHMHGGALLNNSVRPNLNPGLGEINSQGGGIFVIPLGPSSTMDSVLVMGNRSDYSGGAFNSFAQRTGSGFRIINSTIVANASRRSILDVKNGMVLDLENVIIWDNVAAAQISTDDSTTNIANSLVQGSNGSGGAWNTSYGTDLGGNIDTGPGFVQSPVGIAPNVSGNFRLTLGSPAIDVGLNSAVIYPKDNDGNPRIFNTTVDMGAYETQVVCPAGGTTRLYVDAHASGSGLGTSWADALPSLQNALTLTQRCPSNSISEIWVAQGTYYPDDGGYQTDGDREAAFELQNGLAIYGGFQGNETDLGQRDPRHYFTTLSGDIDQDDNTDSHDLTETPTDIVGENSYHVVTASSTGSSAILDGFAITGGMAGGSAANRQHEGGGLFADSGSPTLNNLTLVGNIAQEGGAMTLINGSNPTISNSWFGGNAAGDFGGALHNESSNPSLTNVLFSGNRAAVGGGAIFNLGSSPDMVNVTVAGNMAGGTVDLGSDSITIQLTPVGGGLLNQTGSKPDIRNSIIWNNSDATGTGTASANIKNGDVSSLPVISFSDVQASGGSGAWTGSAGFDGGDNIDTDPQFVIPTDPAGSPSFAGDHRLLATSPAIDVGNNADNGLAVDLGGEARVQGVAIDMGAYETTPAPHLAMHKTASAATVNIGDVITYTYQVVNTGLVSVTNITATDDQLGAISLVSTTLEILESTSGVLTYTVVQGDLPGPLTNTATTTGTSSVSGTVVASDTATVSLSERLRLALTIVPDPGSAAVGETITNTYTVVNNGDVSLSGVTVSDTQLGPVTLDKTTLAPGESASGTKSYTIQSGDETAGVVSFVANGSGTSLPTGNTATRQASALVTVQSSNLLTGTLYLPIILRNN